MIKTNPSVIVIVMILTKIVGSRVEHKTGSRHIVLSKAAFSLFHPWFHQRGEAIELSAI